jgi:3-oxoacyl-[acyl-carrier protein] reductase
VNEVVTGPTATSIAPQARPGDPVGNSPTERFKAPEEIVPLALFLATQGENGPTGQSFSLSRRDL